MHRAVQSTRWMCRQCQRVGGCPSTTAAVTPALHRRALPSLPATSRCSRPPSCTCPQPACMPSSSFCWPHLGFRRKLWRRGGGGEGGWARRSEQERIQMRGVGWGKGPGLWVWAWHCHNAQAGPCANKRVWMWSAAQPGRRIHGVGNNAQQAAWQPWQTGSIVRFLGGPGKRRDRAPRDA